MREVMTGVPDNLDKEEPPAVVTRPIESAVQETPTQKGDRRAPAARKPRPRGPAAKKPAASRKPGPAGDKQSPGDKQTTALGMLQMARNYRRMGKRSKAEKILKQIVSDYGDTEAAGKARELMKDR